MKKIIYRIFISLILIVLSSIIFLSTIGLKTERFNDLITSKITEVDPNLSLNINLYYKFSNKIPRSFNWYSLNNNKEFIPSFTKRIFNQVSTLF